MINSLDATEFLLQARHLPIIDVRSPSEYLKGHIPGAINICLFTDEERALIGTLYHKKGRTEAINTGMELINPKLTRLISQAAGIAPGKKALVHCWRGGIRSESFSFLLKTAGFEISTLTGGYKSYRQKLVNGFKEPVNMIILGGMTGSGKTCYLKMLAGSGIQIIDLESLANHKGSVFGAIGQKEQPTTEQFQNELFDIWRNLDFNKIVVLEDENQNIGAVSLPANLYRRMRNSPLIYLQTDREKRARQLEEEYNKSNDEELCNAIRMIERRLGNQQMSNALKAIEQKDYVKAALILLVYYDKSYVADMAKRSSSLVFPLETENNDKKTMMSIIRLLDDIGSMVYQARTGILE